MKRLIYLFIIGAMLLCGCAAQNSPEETTAETGDNTLWIVTENDGMYLLAEQIMERFQENHEDITVKLERIPGKSEERAAYMEQLRVQIMAGQGPDIYLLPLENMPSNQLFTDVNQCMKNGIFMDIGALYDSDLELNKDGLVSAVMDAGVLDGRRYVLPLRYNYPVACVDVRQLEEAGLCVDDLGGGLSGLTEVIRTLGSSAVSAEASFAYFWLYGLCFLPELIDYEAQEVMLTQAQLAEFMNRYRDLMAAVGSATLPESLPAYSNYESMNSFWALDGHCVHLGSLNRLIYNLRIGKATDTELAVIPLRNVKGELVADVTHFGAVGAGCDEPELAYEFLREFLLEENQWENNLGKNWVGLVSDGWPVLTEGAWADLNEDLWHQNGELPRMDGARGRRTALKFAELTQEDFAILDTPIDVVQLPIAKKCDYMEQIDSMLNPARNPEAMNVDVEEFAGELIQELRWHVAEG